MRRQPDTCNAAVAQCGGHTAAIEAAQPLLHLMGKRTVPCGGPGTGQAAKLCNNLVLAGAA